MTDTPPPDRCVFCTSLDLRYNAIIYYKWCGMCGKRQPGPNDLGLKTLAQSKFDFELEP